VKEEKMITPGAVSKLLAGEKFKPILVVRNFIGIFILFI
jgi:hypothetical protein